MELIAREQARARQSQRAAALQERIKSRNREIKDLQSALTDREKRINAIEHPLAEMKSKMAALAQALAARVPEVEMLRAGLSAQESKISALDQALIARDQEIEALTTLLAQHNSEIQELKDGVAERNIQVLALEEARTIDRAEIGVSGRRCARNGGPPVNGRALLHFRPCRSSGAGVALDVAAITPHDHGAATTVDFPTRQFSSAPPTAARQFEFRSLRRSCLTRRGIANATATSPAAAAHLHCTTYCAVALLRDVTPATISTANGTWRTIRTSNRPG